MKLLITTDSYGPRWDGIARFLKEIIPRLVKKYEITVVCPDFGPTKSEEFTTVKLPLGHRVFGDYQAPRFAYGRIKKLVAESDIVFNQTLGPIGVAAILAAKRKRKPCLSFTHSLEWELFPKALGATWMRQFAYPATRLFVKSMYRRCSVLIVPSENTAEQLTWQGVLTAKRIAHLGVDIKKFVPGEKRLARAALGLPQGAFLIGYHGRIAYEKNLLTLLRAFLRLRIPNSRLLIVGDGVPALKARLRKEGVILVGNHGHVTPYLQAMDLYVMPSLTETTCLSVLEAMACELPVISSRVGFVQHYIHEDENGFFFDMRSEYSLAQKIQLVRSLSPEALATVCTEARQTVVRGFHWDATAQKIADAINEFGPVQK